MSRSDEDEAAESDVRSQLDTLMAWARDFRTSRLLTTAVEHELLERFREEPRSVGEVVRADEDRDAVRRHVRALASLGLLDRIDGSDPVEYRPTGLTRTFLLPESEFDLRPILKLFHRNYDLWRKLPETLTDGHDVENEAFGDVEFGRDFMLAMETRAHFAGKDVAQALESLVDEGDSLIDLGGGTGVFVREILETNPDTRAVLADLPHVVETAREFSEESPVSDRLDYRELDFFEDENYGEGFDMALLFSILHMFSPEKNRVLLNRTADALRPGGTLVLRDYVLNEDGVGPRESNLFDLHMLLATDTGRNYTLEEFRSLLGAAGFGSVRKLELPGHDDLLVAEKSS